MARWTSAGLVAFASLLTGCADMAQTVRAQAARDLRCAEEKVVIVDDVEGIYRLRACGRAATYRCTDGRRVGSVVCEQLDLIEASPDEAGAAPEAPDP